MPSLNSTTQYIRLCGDSQQSNTDTFMSVQKSHSKDNCSAERTMSELYSNIYNYIQRSWIMKRTQTKKGIIFESELLRYMKLRDISSKEKLRSLTTIGSNVTMLKYFDNPELIPLGTMSEIMQALRIPKDERTRIINMLIDG